MIPCQYTACSLVSGMVGEGEGGLLGVVVLPPIACGTLPSPSLRLHSLGTPPSHHPSFPPPHTILHFPPQFSAAAACAATGSHLGGRVVGEGGRSGGRTERGHQVLRLRLPGLRLAVTQALGWLVRAPGYCSRQAAVLAGNGDAEQRATHLFICPSPFPSLVYHPTPGSQVASLELCWNAEESAMLKAGGFLQTKVSKKEVDGCCYANWVTCGVGNIPSLAASSGVLSSLEPPLEAGRRSGAGPGWAFGPDRGSGGPISSEGPSQEGQSSEMGGGVGNGGAVGEDRARLREGSAHARAGRSVQMEDRTAQFRMRERGRRSRRVKGRGDGEKTWVGLLRKVGTRDRDSAWGIGGVTGEGDDGETENRVEVGSGAAFGMWHEVHYWRDKWRQKQRGMWEEVLEREVVLQGMIRQP
ncbi:unnamed protein product [Closterium sp. NIES-64]|nr:unnamed protein product [Closterium sp. NIES-64]